MRINWKDKILTHCSQHMLADSKLMSPYCGFIKNVDNILCEIKAALIEVGWFMTEYMNFEEWYQNCTMISSAVSNAFWGYSGSIHWCMSNDTMLCNAASVCWKYVTLSLLQLKLVTASQDVTSMIHEESKSMKQIPKAKGQRWIGSTCKVCLVSSATNTIS